MREPVLLRDFIEVLPRHRLPQREALDWLARAHHRFDPGADPEFLSRCARRFGCDPDRVAVRFTELEDFLLEDPGSMLLFGGRENGDGLSRRMEVFSRFAARAFAEWYPASRRDVAPDDLYHVSCTGYISPSAAQERISALELGGRTRVTHLYHMGCYASVPALRLAEQAVRAGRGTVDVAHTEACSLHFDPRNHAPEQWVIQSLFADGAIRYRVEADTAGRAGLRLLALREELLPGSANQMGWRVGESGFSMSLAREVPDTVAGALPDFFHALCESAGIPANSLREEGVFAIHPGGPRIIDRVVESLGLRSESARLGRELLRERGNLSSATLPTLWARILADPSIPSGTPIASFAFGPGLSACGAIMVKSR